MSRPTDYHFGFTFKNPNLKAKTVLYKLWISPNIDKVELVIDAEDKYIQLDESQSELLFEVIAGDKLSDLKE